VDRHPGDEDCAFCAIARGEDTSAEIICETDRWVAFFPQNPATPGHTLVIPREHIVDFLALDPASASDLMQGVVRVGNAIETALKPDGMNLISSAGDAATQTVFHVHVHLVPRRTGDRFGDIWPPKQTMDETLEEELANRVRAACVET
jgi:diadenosine tetraphosphate (Ap4A) HIT family hydrolase